MENRNIFFIKWIYVVLQFIFLASFYASVVINKENVFSLIVLFGCSIFIRKAFFCEQKVKDKYIKYFLLFEFVLVTMIVFLARNGNVNLPVLLIADSAYYLSKRVSVVFSIIVYLVCLYPISLYFTNDFIEQSMIFAIAILLSYGLVYFIKRYMAHSEKLVQTTAELQMKRLELEKAYEKLQNSYDIQEEVIVLRERNRIAGEIHDTVGHTLTTVLVEIEAGKRLINKNKIDVGIEKINLAQEQVRKGMNDIRKSVRALKDGKEILSFVESLNKLISDTEKHTGVTIKSRISQLPELDTEIKKIIYRALQEGLTNGIKHGKSKKLRFELNYKDSFIHFILKDYGIGCQDYKFGFGLSNMKYKVEQKKGIFRTYSKSKEGFTIDIKIPE